MTRDAKRARRHAADREDETFTAVDFMPFEQAREAWITFLRVNGIAEPDIPPKDLLIDERPDGTVRYRVHTDAMRSETR